jgi:class 3 adenylate cyclase
VEVPETRYAKTADGIHIAYQVVGEGPFDFVFVHSVWVAGVEASWEFQHTRDWIRWFAARGRVVLFDRRGSGMSDPVSGDRLPTLETRMEDIHAVMDAARIERAILVTVEDGAAHCFLFAATYPERTAAIIASGVSVRGTWAPDFPGTWTEDQWNEWFAKIEKSFGSPAFMEDFVRWAFPGRAGDAEFTQAFGRMFRQSLSPASALSAERMAMETDVRHILPSVQAQTLVIHFTNDQVEPVEGARYTATRVPGAMLVEQPGIEHAWWPGSPEQSEIDTEVDHFLASLKDEEADFDRVLATVLFTDIVGSTEHAVEMGDHAWRDLLDRHHATVRAMIGRYRGREIATAGDGFLATFDGPARAIRCARAATEAVRPLGLEIRAGLHTGEIETIDDDVQGVAVHIGARVAALAGASEVLASQTVKDLVAGSGLVFQDAGEHELKGIPDRWRLYRVVGSSA